MTPAASHSPQVMPGGMLSQALDEHARCLDLSKLMPVGEWDHGQGLRRAKDQAFFFDLRAANFLPFGPNHPLEIAAKLGGSLDTSPHAFPPSLEKVMPGCSTWTWSVFHKDHKWLSRSWRTDGPWLFEDATLKCGAGWRGGSRLLGLQGWSVSLPNDLMFCASPSKLPVTTSYSASAWLRLFFSEDILGPEGRLRSWQLWLAELCPWGTWEGMNLSFNARPGSRESLAKEGYAVDETDGLITAHFALSMWPEDVYTIISALAPYKV